MRILLDECVDWKLSQHLKGHNFTTVTKRGWAGKKNGELLGLAQSEFDVFITVDQNLRFQQNLLKYSIAVVVLPVQENKLANYLPLITSLQNALSTIKPGELFLVEDQS